MENQPKLTLGRENQFNNDTGFVVDYLNNYGYLITEYKESGGVEGVKNLIKKLKEENYDLKIPNYREFYSKYSNAVNSKNMESIKELEELVNHLNDMIENPESVYWKNFCNISNDLNHLIYGYEDGARRDISCSELAEAA
jgi:hypothetical protein